MREGFLTRSSNSMMTAVNSFGGTVTRSSGDGIMALFGAPTALEDHALRACQAALRIQDLVRRLVSENRWGPNVDVNVRVGLNSGEVIVHHIQNQLRVDYSATGHAVHLAARMEQLARPGTILISELTFKACQKTLDVTPLGYMPVKGLPEAQRVFELNGVSATATRLEMAERAGVLSHFVNRDTERAVLDRAAREALQGRGQVVALVGEPGVGKSRLDLRVQQLRVGRSVLPAGRARPVLRQPLRLHADHRPAAVVHGHSAGRSSQRHRR